MSKLDELIAELCPDGVESKPLSEIATITRGGNLQKKDFTESGVPCIHYGQIYTKYGLFTDRTYTFVSESTASKQKKAVPGDIVMAVTSENIEDVCKCVVWLGDEDIAVSGHTAIIHHNQDPKYLAYYFHSSMFFAQKQKLAHGTKVIEVTPDKLNGVRVPVPPLEVQREIVRVLDNFTFLSAELLAELSARRKQYEYYRNQLLSFDSNVQWKELQELFDIVDYRGKTPKKTDSGVFLVTAKNIRKGYIDYEASKEYISPDDYEEVMHRGVPRIGDILITTEAPCSNVALVDRDDIALAQRVIKYRPKNNDAIDTTYVKHYLLGKAFQDRLERASTGGTVKGIKGSKLHLMKIPVPSLDVQRRLARVLENFDSICTDLNIGLPAEIEARQKQYEYYRDLLLTFAETGGTLATDRQTDRQAEITLLQYVFGYAIVQLGEVILSLNTGLNPRQFFKLNTEDADNYYVTKREIVGGRIVTSEKTDRMDNKALRLWIF